MKSALCQGSRSQTQERHKHRMTWGFFFFYSRRTKQRIGQSRCQGQIGSQVYRDVPAKSGLVQAEVQKSEDQAGDNAGTRSTDAQREDIE